MSLPLSLADIEDAARQLKGVVLSTPFIISPYLSTLIKGHVYLKLENLQVTGSFKPRGAYIKLKSLSGPEKERGVIAMSAGNHAQGVAYHAEHMGIPATIVMPETTPLAKVERTRQYGATVLLSGENLAESEVFALPIAAKEGLTIIHPYNDLAIIQGQATVGLEMFQDRHDLDSVIVPLGGGGLAAGIILAGEYLSPQTRVYGVQSTHCTAMSRRLFPHKSIPQDAVGVTIAEGIAVKAPGQIPFDILNTRLEDALIVNELLIEQAIDSLAIHQKIIVEGAAAAGVAALMATPHLFEGKRVGIVICGGNIDSRILSLIVMRGMAHRHQLISLRVEINDTPGVLSQVTGLIGQARGNVLELHHQRWFNALNVKMSDLELIVEIRDRPHGQEIIHILQAHGFCAQAIHL